ncbi:MAG TPA: TonB-dependent receptor [Bryobacteraceae bacterium]|nr:TonB-dependent receptor [Bryobacteraceae bacterium]
MAETLRITARIVKALSYSGLYLFATVVCFPLSAQQTGISGGVSDPSGATVASAKVSITGEDGTKATTLTNTGGLYQFPGLRAGNYRLRMEAPGFTPAERTITLLVGQTATVDVAMQLSETSSAVNVEAAANAVDTSNSNVAGEVSPTEMSKIPLNGRNYLQLAMMVPGITSNDVQNSPLGSTDSGKFQINVDGQQVTQNAAGTGFGQPILSDDAIDQYQIITNRFDATMGRASRLQVIVQTKSGTNSFHGTLFGYFRNSAFNASDSVAHTVLPFSDQQFGGTVGGPILKNKLFFFFSFEGERQPSTSVDSPTSYFDTSGKQITLTFPNLYTTRAYLLHMDYQINNNQHLGVRASGSTWGVPVNGVAGNASPQGEYSATRKFYAVTGTWNWTIKPTLVNELKIGFNHFDWSYSPLLLTQGFQGLDGGSWGAPYNYPEVFSQNATQFRDDLFWLKGDHSFKFGADYQHLPYSGNFGQYVRGVATGFNPGVTSIPLISIFPVWNDPSTWNLALLNPYVTTYVQGFGNFLYNIPTNNVGAWVQDDWKVSKKLTLNLGLRYDNDLGIFNPDLHLTGPGAPETPHYNQNYLFQPRLGFVYDLTGSRKTVIRGGAGIFYADIQANQTIDGQIFNGQTTLSPSLSPTAAKPINLMATPNPFGYTGDQFLSGQAPTSIQSIQPLGPGIRTPYSLQISGGVERQFPKNWTASADFVHFRIYHDWLRDDANLYENLATGYAQNPSTFGRPDAYYSNIKNFTTPDAAGSIYNALLVSISHRFSQNFSAQAAYTLSHLKDSTTGPFSYPNNPFNLAAEWAVSPDNQANTLTLAGTYLVKWGITLSGQLHYGSGQNFNASSSVTPLGLSGVVSNRLVPAATTTYVNPSCISAASNFSGENVLSRDCFVGNPIMRVDLRLSKTFTLKERFRFIPIVEAFNLFNHSNFGSYQTTANVSTFGVPAQVTTIGDLTYQARMLQFAGRFEF